MDQSNKPDAPPQETNAKGDIRRVGVEIEYANLNVPDSADMIEELFGGYQERESEHRVKVLGTSLGDFLVELDWQGAHKLEKSGSTSTSTFEDEARVLAGRTASLIVPIEIVCPPIPWTALDQLDVIFDSLRKNGAEGTETGIFCSFGLHLNPEVAEETAEYALRHLQAYAILEDWLREQVDIDWSRRMLPHIDPLPTAYLRKLLDIDYAPDLETLIRDYVEANQTRNRGLDMTPLFRHLREETVTRHMKDPSLVKARPTFHYRLPDARLSDPDWGAVQEWNRWLSVERLAADTDLLHQRKLDFAEWLGQSAHQRWIEKLKDWFGAR